MPIAARHRMITIEKRESNSSAEPRLTAVRTSGSEACHAGSPVGSERPPHHTIAIDASANGMLFNNPVCMLVRPYDLMICGCHNCKPLLTAVLPDNTTLSTSTCLFHSTRHVLDAATGRSWPGAGARRFHRP